MKPQSWNTAFAAALVLTGPALAVLLAGQFLNANNTTLAQALVPMIVAVFASVSGEAEHSDFTGLLWPGSAGVAGLLLLVPQPTFGAVRPWLGMLAIPVLVGAGGGIWSRQRKQSPYLAGYGQQLEATWGLFIASTLFAVLAMLHRRAGGELAFSISAAVLDGVTAALTLLILQRVPAIRWSAQFLLIPLVGLVEGVVLLRPFLDWRSYLAFGLMGVSALYQWMAYRPSDREDVVGQSATRVPEA